MSTDQSTERAFEAWCVIELFGHTRVGGRVSDVQLFGARFLRSDVPATPGQPEHTSFYGAGSVYGVHPVTEELARAVAEQNVHRPVRRWELPAAPAGVDDDPDDDPEGEGVWGG
jgi:hypothetical protein